MQIIQNPGPQPVSTYSKARLATSLHPNLGDPNPVLWTQQATYQGAEGKLVLSSWSWPGTILP